MEETILQQIESLEMIMNSQERRLNIALNHLRELARINKNFIIFGKISEDEQFEKQLILAQYERD
jgi:ribosomal protein L18E